MNKHLALLAVALVACKGGERAAAPSRVAAVGGFQVPESVKWDSAQDVYFVSNIRGVPSAKDNNGFISRVRPDGTIEDTAFVAGGKNGVTLDAPKGMALVGDTLWVTDINAVRGFNARTGAAILAVDLSASGAVFLNDVAVAPDGSLYVTDTGIRISEGGVEHPGPDRIFRIAPDRTVSVAAQGDTLARPNGITWDRANGRFIVVPFGGTSLSSWKPGDAAPTPFATGPGSFDGVEIVGSAIWVSTWADSSVYRFEGGTGTKLITGVPSPADIGYDAKRNRLLIPVFQEGRIEIWQLP